MDGLSSEGVKNNRIKYGSNNLEKQKGAGFAKKFIIQFKNLMVLVLLFSAIVSGTLAIINHSYSDLFESAIILFIVLANALVGALQERKAENTLALLEKKTSSQAKVIRSGKLIKIAPEEIVVGDIVELKTGDFVPADIRLIETNNFSCDESSLTGESKKVNKNSNPNMDNNSIISEKSNICFKGTIVSSGNATGVVIATGMNAEIGKIANLIKNNKKEKTPLEKNIDKIGKVITICVSIIVVVVFLVQIIFSQTINWGDSFMTAIALAVAAIPESLPAVITIIMALGVQRLAKHKAIVKNLSSVETLGCCTCICSDKTGTLTQNQMKVVSVFSSMKFHDSYKTLHHINATAISHISSLCNNVKLDLNSNIQGDATEKALFKYLEENKFDFDACQKENKRLHEEPFDSNKKYMISINKAKSGELFAYIKGASDVLLKKCESYLDNGTIKPLTHKERTLINKAVSTCAKNAQRVILLGLKKVNSVQDNLNDNYIFVALAGLIDPPRPEAYDAIQKCYRAGLKPIMITGDHKETAFVIASNLKICKNANEVITGKELDNLSNEQLESVIHKYKVFARVTPEHKSRIVKAFKSKGEVVAMTGDGVNDAPSIKQSDIGVCMGTTGTDVTKSVSDLVITNDNFASIVLAVSTGRTIYNNIQKTLQFLISTNAVEVLGLFIVSLLMHNSVFLFPSQILFINLITDSLPAFALGLEPPEKNIMDQKPRDPKSTIFSGTMGTAIIYEAFVQTLVVLVLFVIAYHTWGNEIATTMSFLTICLMQILHALNCKTSRSIFSINIFENKTFNISFILLLLLILAVGLIPGLQTVFSIVSLSSIQWLIVILCSIAIIPLVELGKHLLYNKNKV